MVNNNKNMPDLNQWDDDASQVTVATKNSSEGKYSAPIEIPHGSRENDKQAVNIPKKSKKSHKKKENTRRSMADKQRRVMRHKVEVNAIMREINKEITPNRVRIVIVATIIVMTGKEKI